MNSLLKYMPPYAIILLVMGIVLFLVLIFLLIWNVMKNRPITSLLPFFLLPVIMVAYTVIKSISIGNVVIDNTNKVENLTKTVVNNPGDTAAIINLKNAVAKLKSINGAQQTGKSLLAIANAQIAVGRYDSASLYLHKAEKVASGMERIDSSRQVLARKIKLKDRMNQAVIGIKQ